MPYWITQSYLPPDRGSISCPNRSLCYSRYLIYPPIKDERLSRPELMQLNELPRVATEVLAISDVSWLSQPFAPLGMVDVND